MWPSSGKDLEMGTLGATLVLPSVPTCGAFALSDIPKFPLSETNSF